MQFSYKTALVVPFEAYNPKLLLAWSVKKLALAIYS